MVIALVGFSLNILAFVLFVLSTLFWFPRWRNSNGQSGTAHALFLTNATLAIATVFKIAQTITKLINDDLSTDNAVNVVTTLLIVFVSIFQYALIKGYFNIRGEEDGRIG